MACTNNKMASQSKVWTPLAEIKAFLKVLTHTSNMPSPSPAYYIVAVAPQHVRFPLPLPEAYPPARPRDLSFLQKASVRKKLD